jgi:hypothetical protein
MSHPAGYDAGENKVVMKGNGIKKPDKRRRQAAHAREERNSAPKPAERGVAGYSRPPLARMLRLHQCMMENTYPNCRQMAEEFEVAAKTVQRDINFMRDQMRLPIEYDKERFGFRYTRAVTALPAVGLTSIQRTGSPVRRAAAPSIGEKPELGSSRGGFMVRIGFDPDCTRAVRARTWHASQVIHTLPGGTIEMTLKLRDEAAVAQWVLSWAAGAWVIEPARLRARVEKLAGEIAARHRGHGINAGSRLP